MAGCLGLSVAGSASRRVGVSSLGGEGGGTHEGRVRLLEAELELREKLGYPLAMAVGAAVLGDGADTTSMPCKTIRAAVWQVAIADVSMSLDNVVAVAGVADDHPRAMVFGLLLSVILMGVGATFIAALLQRHPWVAYLGLALIVYVALAMIWRGGFELAQVAGI